MAESPFPQYSGEIRSVSDLTKALEWVNSLGFIPAISKGPHSVGTTLEILLGHPLDSLPFRDFEGCEVKAQREEASSPMTLFTKTPIWNKDYGWRAKRVLEEFGYEDNDGHSNALRINLYSSPRHGLRLQASHDGIDLIVDETEERIGTWTTERFIEGFERKANNIVYIKAESRIIDGFENFHYKETYHCILKDDLDAGDLLTEIDNGNLALELRMYLCEDHQHCWDYNRKKGLVRDHGPAIRCSPSRLKAIYNITQLL